jgi:succinyl-diaminopimelate desuccinylase
MFKEALLATIDAERGDLISFLQSLTRADSSNPPGDTIAAACVVTTFLASHDVPATLIAPKHLPGSITIARSQSFFIATYIRCTTFEPARFAICR